MTSTDALRLEPAVHAQGGVDLPGSKSISNRALLLAALAEGTTRLEGLLDSDDTRVMLAALRTLGVAIDDSNPGCAVVTGAARWPTDHAELFLGNAGTAFRPLTAALALMGGSYRLSGIPRMHERPIGDLVDALRLQGARVEYTGQQGFPPLAIAPAGELAQDAPVRVQGSVSSQFLTALLMAAPLAAASAGRDVAIEVVGELTSRPYIDITLNLMRRFGVQVRQDGPQRFIVPADAAYVSPGHFA